MPSIVQICNMALSHIGSEARVASLSPPDGSAEAGYCAAFYDQARTEMIEAGQWNFALKRATLAEVTNASTTWAYAYALPSDCLRALRILRPGVGLTVFTEDQVEYSPNDGDTAEFTIEGDVAYTNEPEAVLLYLRDVTDPNSFTPGFTGALSYMLAAYLAGPIIKGSEGLRVADGMRERATAMGGAAAAANANAAGGTNEFTPSQHRAR